MRQINVKIENDQGATYNVHVYDLYLGGRKEVVGSPFLLAPLQPSPFFTVGANNNEYGVIGYSSDGGPSRSGIQVSDRYTVHI
jgi:hypothetical protein